MGFLISAEFTSTNVEKNEIKLAMKAACRLLSLDQNY